MEVKATTTSMPRDVIGGIVMVTHIADPGSPSVTVAEELTSKEATDKTRGVGEYLIDLKVCVCYNIRTSRISEIHFCEIIS